MFCIVQPISVVKVKSLHTMKAYREVKVQFHSLTSVLDGGVVMFHTSATLSSGKEAQVPLKSRMCGSQSQFGCFIEQRNLQPLTGIELQLLSCPACNIDILLTDCPGLLLSSLLHFLFNSYFCFQLFLFSFSGLLLCLGMCLFSSHFNSVVLYIYVVQE